MSRSDFWSKRREAVAEEARAETAALAAEKAAASEARIAERSDEEILQELNLPEPEQLDSAEAVREFMTSAVPQRLKTRALRQLWKLNPVLANLDGLVDYGEDFTDSATVIENLQTAYQVGKGMLSHLEAMAAQAEVQEDPDVPAEDESDKDQVAAEDIDTPVELEPAAHDPAAHDQVMALTEEHAGEEAEPEVAPSRRRMQFRFEMHP